VGHQQQEQQHVQTREQDAGQERPPQEQVQAHSRAWLSQATQQLLHEDLEDMFEKTPLYSLPMPEPACCAHPICRSHTSYLAHICMGTKRHTMWSLSKKYSNDQRGSAILSMHQGKQKIAVYSPSSIVRSSATMLISQVAHTIQITAGG